MLDDTSLFINDEATIKGTLIHISKYFSYKNNTLKVSHS